MNKKHSIISIKNVSQVYQYEKNKIYSLQDVSLDIDKQDIYGIIGLSGAGKSSLIRILASLAMPTSGSILFNGEDIAKMDKYRLRDYRKKIGMVFQHFNLLTCRDVAGNIAYPMEIVGVTKEDREKKVEKLLELVGLSHKKHSYSSQLSGGEKQRVAIARSLANDPEVLFCDEATSALDPKTTKEILQLLKNINKTLGVTIVLITHAMDVVKQICNKVAVIEKGRIIEEGSVVKVFTEPTHPVTKHLLESEYHDIPVEFFKDLSPHKRLLRLRFKGETSEEPIISEIVMRFQVKANILLGWIDRLQTLSVGTLIIELLGEPDKIDLSLEYLEAQHVLWEELSYESR